MTDNEFMATLNVARRQMTALARRQLKAARLPGWSGEGGEVVCPAALDTPEEVVSAAVAHLWEKREDIDMGKTPVTYFAQAARRAAMDAVRAATRRAMNYGRYGVRTDETPGERRAAERTADNLEALASLLTPDEYAALELAAEGGVSVDAELKLVVRKARAKARKLLAQGD